MCLRSLVVLCACFAYADAQARILSMGPEMNNQTNKQAAAIISGVPIMELGSYGLVGFFGEEVRKQGILVFRDMGNLSVNDVKLVARYFGKKLYEGGPKHPASDEKAVYVLSNDEEHGVTSLNTEGWHNDGYKRSRPHTHNVYHMTSVSQNATTMFISLDDFVDSLEPETKALWDRIWIRYGGNKSAIHPLIFHHPITKFETMVFHVDKVREMYWDYGTEQQRLATPEEKTMLVTSLKAELNKDYGKWHYLHKWQPGDVIVTDNLITVHQEHPNNSLPVSEVGLRQMLCASVLSDFKPRKKPGTEKPASLKLADEEGGDFQDDDDDDMPLPANFNESEYADSVKLDAGDLMGDAAEGGAESRFAAEQAINLNERATDADTDAPTEGSDAPKDVTTEAEDSVASDDDADAATSTKTEL